MKSKLDPAVTDAIWDGRPIADAKMAALATFTRTLVKSRGFPSKADVQSFLAAGDSEQQILEIVLAISVKTLSNYANHLFHTPLDPVFKARRWADKR